MKLFSYVVARDFGFAPNPFFGVCTLATCKPNIRRVAGIGDWVVGTGSKQKGNQGKLVFVMQVTDFKTFSEYWKDIHFTRKRPNLRGSLKLAYGDNIYYKDQGNHWHQSDSHHSYAGGKLNRHNLANDTQVDRVLISTSFAYWGGAGPKIPAKFRNHKGIDICARRNHKSQFSPELVDKFIAWFQNLDKQGYLGKPLDWQGHHD